MSYLLYLLHQVKDNTLNQKGNAMKIHLSLMLIITALIDYIPWTMGKVPYGALCWIIPLIVGFIFASIHELDN